MKFMKSFYIGCFFLLPCVTLQADQLRNTLDSDLIPRYESCCSHNIGYISDHSTIEKSHNGSAGFGVTDPTLWYTLSTNSYPESVPLSLNRNKGLSKGGVYLSPTGFTIGEAGDYWVSITAILQNPGTETILIPVFLAINEEFDASSPGVGGVVTLEPNLIISMQGTGIVQNIEAGTRLSLVATNGGAPFPQDVTVAGWGISLFKLP